MPRLRRILGRARVRARLVPTDATAFLSPEESGAVFRVVSSAIRHNPGLLSAEGSALWSALRRLDAGRTHVPQGPRLVHVPRRGEA